MTTSSRLRLAVLAAGLCLPAAAFSLEAGMREVPAKEVPVPTAGVSPQEQAVIGAALPPYWNDHPKDAAAWKALINMRAEAINKTLPGLRERSSASSPSRSRSRASIATFSRPTIFPSRTAIASWFTCMAAVTSSPPARPPRAKRS